MEAFIYSKGKNLRQLARDCLIESDPYIKYDFIREIECLQNTLDYELSTNEQIDIKEDLVPGRPSKPILVKPLDVKKRAMHTLEGRATAIHALAHIEFNAINLALDAVWRFSSMPKAFYIDWLKVAFEEAKHFYLLNQHLKSIGYSYGDFPAHDSLWVKDVEMVHILDIILRDEIGHVEIGNKWFNFLCHKKEIDPIKTYFILSKEYKAPQLRGPFNMEARIKAGFTEEELSLLTDKPS